MPLQIPVPEKPQHGAGQFEVHNAFSGLAGLRFAWATSLGYLFPRLGIGLGEIPAPKTGPSGLDPVATAALFATGTEAALAEIGKGLSATQSGYAEAQVTHAAALDGIAAGIAVNASDTLNLKKHVARVTAPKVITRVIRPNIKAAVAPYAKRTAEAEARAKHAEATAAKLGQRVSLLERKVGKTSSVALPGIEGRLGEIDRALGRVEGKVRKLGKYAGIGAFLLLLAKALEKMGVNWIRCSNVKQYGKNLCGMNSQLLASLLLDTVLIVSALSLRDLVNEVLSVEDQLVAGVKRSIRELHGIDAVREGGYTGTANGRT